MTRLLIFTGKEMIMDSDQRTLTKSPNESASQTVLPGLYDPSFEHDNCGIGAVANIKGIPSHRTVEQALHIV